MSLDRAREIPDLILEQYRLGELPPRERARVERIVREDAAVRERLEALDGSDASIERMYPPGVFAARARERLAEAHDSRRLPRGRLAFAATLVVALLTLAVVLPWGTGDPPDRGDRVKGLDPTLIVYRRTPEGSETLADGAAARAGDLLRLGYVSAGRSSGVILSIDGRGIVTIHLPPNGSRAAPLRAGGTILLDDAYELDDAPAWERFYFVTGDRAFDVGRVVEAARREAARAPRTPPDALPLPRELGQAMFSLQKEVRP